MRSYGAAFHHIGLASHHEQELRKNNRAKNWHQLVDDKSARCSASNRFDLPNRFLSVHAVVHNTFNGTVNLVGLAALASRHGGE